MKEAGRSLELKQCLFIWTTKGWEKVSEIKIFDKIDSEESLISLGLEVGRLLFLFEVVFVYSES